MTELTKEQFIRVLPKDVKTKVSQKMVDTLNGLMKEPALRENYRDNLLAYTSVMKDGKYKIGDYLNAVRYVSYKLLGSSNIEAYTKTFPDRFSRLVAEGADEKTISSYCAAYNKTKLVQGILEQTLTPVHVLNADIYQKAINKQALIMSNPDASYKVQSDAANSLLTHLKAPEVSKIELDMNVKQDKTVEDLRGAILELGKTQRKMIESGNMNASDIAKSSILINQEVEDGEIVDE